MFLPTTGFFLLKNEDVQNYLVDELSERFSEKLGAQVSIGTAYYTLFNKIVLKDVYLEDRQGDPLLRSERVTGHLKYLSLRERQLYFREVALENARIRLSQDTSGKLNLHFLVQELKREDTTKERMQLHFNEIRLKNSHLTLARQKTGKGKKLPFSRELQDLDLRVQDLNADSGRVRMNIKHLAFKDQNGFEVKKLSTRFRLNRAVMELDHFALETPRSNLKIDSLHFTHDQYEGFKSPLTRLRFELTIQPSRIDFRDMAYFSKKFRNLPDQQLIISGHFKGPVDKLKGRKVHLAMGRQTELLTDFSLDGLPDISRTFMYIDMNHFYTGIRDLKVLNRFLPKDNKISLPQSLSHLGRVRYRGNFTGFIDDFVAYGTFNTELGEISTDLLIQPRQKEGLALKGNLKTRNFDIGGLVDNRENVGKFSMNMEVKGSLFQDRGFRAQTDGTIEKLEINRYNYSNIQLNGLLTHKKYDGVLSIDDPNIQFNFHGGIDFSGEVPVFDFNARLANAKLNKLNISPEDTTANLSFSLMSNFRGSNLDDASGVIRMTQGKLVKNNKELHFDNFQLDAEHKRDSHRITVKSDHIEAQLVGRYRSTTIYQSLKNLTLSYLPIFIKTKKDTASVNFQNDFRLTVNLKQTHKITEIFLPNVSLSDSSKVRLDYRGGGSKYFELNARADNMRFKNWNFKNLLLESHSQDSSFALNINFDQVITEGENPIHYLHDFRLKSLTGYNKSKFLTRWNEPGTQQQKGELISLIDLERNKKTGNLRTNLFLLPGDIHINGQTWHVAQSSVVIDSSSYNFNDLSFYHQDQRMFVNGLITKDPTDTLKVEFSQLTLDHANVLFPKNNLVFNGTINGKASLSNLYDQPSFQSNLSIDTLFVNNQKIGNTRIHSAWNNQKEHIALEIESQRGKLKTIDIGGTYKPENQDLRFNLQLDKLRMAALNPILQKNFSGFNGALSGQLNVRGTANHPLFSGRVSAQKTSFIIDYLQTEYNLTHTFDVANNTLLFKDVRVNDQKGHSADVNGKIQFNTLKDIDYSFIIDAEQFRALNTTGLDNNIYYGNAYASGLVNIQGNTRTKNLNIDASLTTGENTRINLPIGDRGRASKTQFITFTGEDDNGDMQTNEKESYQANLSGLIMNFDLEVTPQARTRIIFDPELRDIIEARGRGNLNMEVNNSGDFRIYGNYTIEEGDYMFSLKNVIRKEFEIEQGSQIIWNGQPQNADINVTAVYNLRTSLNNLLMDTTQYYNKRIPVECRIQLTEKLVNPNINFDIALPTADESTRARVQGAINTEEELNKQFLSLLVLNTFMPSQQYMAGQNEAFGMGASSMAFTTSELLSNQLSHWLSQISNNWDIGVNYQPGDEISKDQMEVALSTQLLNNRLIINGNVETTGKYQQASELVGDFRVDWKLTPNGKLRLKFFNRNSDRLVYEETRYIQGAGLFYREEFNSFSELLNNIADKLSSKKKKARKNEE